MKPIFFVYHLRNGVLLNMIWNTNRSIFYICVQVQVHVNGQQNSTLLSTLRSSFCVQFFCAFIVKQIFQLFANIKIHIMRNMLVLHFKWLR